MGQKCNILIVDDSEPDQFITKTILQSTRPDCNIYKAYDGTEALEMIQKDHLKPCVILLDLNMPGMNGFTFLEKYNALADEKTPTVVLSSSSASQDKERSLQYDFVPFFMSKPINAEGLKDIENYLEGRNHC